MNKHLKLALSLALTGAIMGVLYSMADMEAMGAVFASGDKGWFAFYLALLLPQVFLAGLRWRSLVHHFAATRISVGRAFSQCLGAYAANLIVPSKLGEFVKGLWLNVGERKFLPFFLVAMEKLLDIAATLGILTLALVVVIFAPEYQSRELLLSILAVLLLGWLVAALLLKSMNWPVKLVNKFFVKGDEAVLLAKWREVKGQQGALVSVGAQSVALWVLQLVQFWCMFKIFGVSMQLPELFVGVPIALFAGALPLTTGGVGLRDAALLWYFGTRLSMEVVLSVGILSLLRIVLTGLMGLPFFFVQMREGKHGK